MTSNILANNNFDEDTEIQIVEVDSNSCLTFEETKALCEEDVSQRDLNLETTSRTRNEHFNHISALMEPNSSHCADHLKVSDFSD